MIGMTSMTSMDKISSRLTSCINEIFNLCKGLEISKEEEEWMKLFQQVELKASLSGLEIPLALQTFILSCSSMNALKNIMLLFIRKVSFLINELGILQDEQLAQEALLIVNSFWSVCANQHAALLKKVASRFSAEFYEILPSLASIYVDLFIGANISKIKVKKLSRQLYGRLNYELNERCFKTSLLEVSECSTAGAKILSPILIKLLSEPPAKNSESHLDYLLHFLLLKRWLPVCGDLKDTAEPCRRIFTGLLEKKNSSSRIKAPGDFVQWLVRHWPQGSDYIPADKSLKGRRVSELLLELDAKATEELIDVFSECLVSDEGKTGDNMETSKPVFVIDKKGNETRELTSTKKKRKKRRKIEDKLEEMEEDVAPSSDVVMLPGNLNVPDLKNKSTLRIENWFNRENETIELVDNEDDKEDDDDDDTGNHHKEEAMELDDSGEIDCNQFHKKNGRKEKKSDGSDTDDNNIVMEAEKGDRTKGTEMSAEPLGFFIDRNSKSPEKQPGALTLNPAFHYFPQKSPNKSRHHGETEMPVKNHDMEIQIIDLRGISEQKDSVHKVSNQDLIILKSPDMNSPNLRREQISSSTQKTERNAQSPLTPAPNRAKQKAETLILDAGNEHPVSKPLATVVDLISNEGTSSSEDNGQSERDLMQGSQTFPMSVSPKKCQATEAEIVAASDSDESQSGSPFRGIMQKRKRKSDQRTRASSISPEIEIIGSIGVSQQNFHHSRMGKSTTELDGWESKSLALGNKSKVVDLTQENINIESDSVSGNDDDEQVIVIEENLTNKFDSSMSLADTDAVEVIHEDVTKPRTSEQEIGKALAEIRRSMNIDDKNQKSPLGAPSNNTTKLRIKSEGSTNPSPNRRSKGGNSEKTAVKSITPKSNVLTDWLRRTPSLPTCSNVLHQLDDLMPENKNVLEVESEGVTPVPHTRKPPRHLPECDKIPQKDTSPEKKIRSSQSKSPRDKCSSELNTTDQPLSVTTKPKKQTESESMISQTHKLRRKSESSHSNVREAQVKKLLSSTKKKRTSLPLTLPNTKISNEINSTEQVISTATTPKKRMPSPVKSPFTKLSQKITNTNSEAKSLLKSPLTVEQHKSPLPFIASITPQNQGKKQKLETPKELTLNDIFGKSLKTYSRQDSASVKKQLLAREKKESKEEIKLTVSKLPTGVSDSTISDSSPQRDLSSPLKRSYFLRGSATKRSECQACGLKQDCTEHQQSVTGSNTGPGSAKANKKEVKVATPSQKTPKNSPMSSKRKSLRSSSNKL